MLERCTNVPLSSIVIFVVTNKIEIGTGSSVAERAAARVRLYTTCRMSLSCRVLYQQYQLIKFKNIYNMRNYMQTIFY